MEISQQPLFLEGRRIEQVINAQQREDNKTIDIYLYDVIQGDQVDARTGKKTKSETSARYYYDVLKEHPDAKQINLYVNSSGGSVIEAMGIRGHLLRHPAHKTAYVDGWAASAASFVITACDETYMLTGAMQMLHSMWIAVIGNAKELRKAADDLDRIRTGNKAVYLERAKGKLTAAKLEQLMANETWLTANECVELGLADRIISSMDYGKGKEETKELLKQSTDIGHAVNNKQASLEGFIAAMIKAAQKRADENI
jgi:ATP-dependent Clp protease protease subunit